MSTPPGPTDGAYPSAAKAWAVVFLLLIIYTVSFIDRQILALLVQPIKRDLALSDTAFSLLTGFAFAVFYTLLGLPFARIADSKSRKALISFGVAFWSLATAACGLAGNFWQLFAARIGVGVGEATLTPAANSMIPDMFKPDRVGRAVSIYTLGIPVGSALAFIFGGGVVSLVSDMEPQSLPVLGSVYGWQFAFFIVGFPGIALAVIMLMVREPTRRGRVTASGDGLPLSEVVAYLASRWRAYGPLFLGAAMKSMLGYGTLSWIIAYLIRIHDIPASSGGVIVGFVLLTAGVGGIISGPLLADRLILKGRMDAHLRVLFIAGLFNVVLAIAFPLVPSLWASMVLFFLATYVSQFPWATCYAAIARVTPNEMRGQATAVYLFIVNIFGLGAGPTVYALFTDYVYQSEALLHYSMASSAAVIAPIAVVLFWLGMKPFGRAMAEARRRELEGV